MNSLCQYFLATLFFMVQIGQCQNFNDNLASEAIGDFPSQWDLLQGSAQISILDGEKVIELGNNTIITPLIQDEIPERFTVEFDVFFTYARRNTGYQYYQVRLWDGTGNGKSNAEDITYHPWPFRIFRHGVKHEVVSIVSHKRNNREFKNYVDELDDADPTWRHLTFDYSSEILKVYIDDILILNIPRPKFTPSGISIEGYSNQGEADVNAVKNIRIGAQRAILMPDIITNTTVDPNVPDFVPDETQDAKPIPDFVPDEPLEKVTTPDFIPSKTQPRVFSDSTLIDEETRSAISKKYPVTTSETSNGESSIDSTILSNPTLTKVGAESDVDDYIGLTDRNSEECGFIPTDYDWRILLDSNSNFNRRMNYIDQNNMSIPDLLKLSKIEVINNEILLSSNAQFVSAFTDQFIPIPIVAHILRKSNRTGGLSTTDLLNSINRANKLYEKFNVFFHLEKVVFIDNDSLYDTEFENDEDFIAAINLQNVSNKLNIYFVPNSETSWANFPSKSKDAQHILMNNGQAKNESTLAHEIGHWFNLLHTHASGAGIDYIGNIYCANDGDLVCDTPPDPNLSKRVDESNCRYTGLDTITSPYGTAYNPDPSLIMSYAPKKCRTKFSERQIKRMYNAYLGMEQDRGYTFTLNREIGKNIKNYEWSSGWDSVLTYDIGAHVYLFLLKSTTGDVHIHRFNNDGSVGERIFDKDWSSGWTSATIFGVGTKKYLFLLKKSSGEVHINKINGDGTIGSITFKDKWTPGWSNVEIINKHLFLLKSESGDMHINKLNFNDGTVGAKITDELWSSGWDVTEVIGNKLIIYKSGTGDIHVQELNDQGKFESPIYDKRWTSGWSHISFLPSHDTYYQNTFKNLLLLRESNGEIKQNQWIDGTIGPGWYDSTKVNSQLGSGWNQALHYDVFDGSKMQNYALLLNTPTGQVKLYHLNNNLN